jgi:hypothetical protein
LDFKAKKIWFIETKFVTKGKTENLEGEKETWGDGREIFINLFMWIVIIGGSINKFPQIIID